MTDSRSDYLPTADWAHLRRRAELLRRVRQFFDARDFLEVETPLLSHDTIVDQHVDPQPVHLIRDARDPDSGELMWLQTSPEFGMKRLLAAGAEAIYQITRAFRAGERGPWHNPEFTIVEWYRVGDDLVEGMRLLDEMAQSILERGPAERIRYADAFQRVLGIDPHRSSTDQLAAIARRHGLTTGEAWPTRDRNAWLDWLLVTCVEPTLGLHRPTIVFDYPADQAALAVVRPGAIPLAERFELYVDGIELANGYHELTDADVLCQRVRQANQARVADGKYPLPEPSRLETAMRHGLPPATGVAMGFDRLVMVATGATQLSQVMAFPIERA
jgi:elongation factor P--(R)-beta-lysine ligase